MSTRAHIDFYDDHGAGPVHLAGVYHHCDGYPEWIIPSFQRAAAAYLDAAKRAPGFAYRADRIDIGDFAAFYILTEKPSEFTHGIGNVYLDNHLHGDEEYVYRVTASGADITVEILEPAGDFWHHPDYDHLQTVEKDRLTRLNERYPDKWGES